MGDHVAHETRAHAKLSASGAYRWLECTAAPTFEEQFPDKESLFAKEGSLAHELAELTLNHRLGRITDEQYQQNVAAIHADELYSTDMADYVGQYVDYCMDRITKARATNSDAEILVETRLDFSRWVPEGFGTGDLVIVCDGTILVCDLKYGKGKAVDAFDNSQAKLYALGAVSGFSHLFDFDWVEVCIFQPRVSSEPSTWQTSVKDLLHWGELIKPIAKEAFSGFGHFRAGDHCDFCRGRGRCRTLADHNIAAVTGEFKDINLLSDAEIGELLKVADQRIKWYGALKEQSLKDATLKGTKYPGWKLVSGRSTRRYRDQDAVASRLTVENAIPAATIYEPPTLLGITAMEKALGKKQFQELLGDLIDKPPGKPTLAPADDPREELDTALNGFNFDTNQD